MTSNPSLVILEKDPNTNFLQLCKDMITTYFPLERELMLQGKNYVFLMEEGYYKVEQIFKQKMILK